MKPFKHAEHRSQCPMCGDSHSQTGWAFGATNLNLTIMRAAAIVNDALLEAAFSYCPTCDFGYFFPRPPQALLDEFYAHGGGRGALLSDDIELSSLQSDFAKSEVATVTALMQDCGVDLRSFKSRRVLEVGPGLSSFIPAFLELGMEYWGNEIGIETSAFLERVFRVGLIRQTLENIPVDLDGTFHLVFSKDSLEHHPNPLLSLSRMEKLLTPGGWLVVLVPNLNSRAFKEGSVTHPYYAFPPHLNYFSKDTFARHLAGLGMENVDVRTFSFSSEVFYCMELSIKLGLLKPDGDCLRRMTEMGEHERLLVVAKKPSPS
jgi:SAM-dependent methyltransferase